MKKVAFVAFSDLHLNNWNISYLYSGNRLADSILVLKHIINVAAKLKVPILFGGDLFHRPRSLDNEVIDAFTSVELKTMLIGIDGNHDQAKANTHINLSPSYFESFAKGKKNMVCINGMSIRVGNNTMVHGIPYMKHNVGFRTLLKKAKKVMAKNIHDKHILIIHTDLPGALKDNGMKAIDVENIKSLKMFKDFDLVLCGHIHKAQVVAPKIVMMGSPYQQSLAEMGDKKGYWLIYDDMSYEFIPIKGIPTYKRYDMASPPEDTSKHIWVPQKMQVIEFENGSSIKFDAKQDRQSIAKAYLQETKQKDKSKKELLIGLIKKVS
jgi:DNA repair exonuclease SbcCD nuclease subunit